MRFEVRGLADYSDTALLEEIRRVATAVPDGALTTSVFRSHSRASVSTFRRRFGGWRNALEAAGLGARYAGPPVSARMRAQAGRSTRRDEVVAELRRVSSLLGRSDLTVEDFNAHGRFSSATVRAHFPLWRHAVQAAGLSHRPSSARYTDEECYENLLRVWTHYGRQPQYREMRLPPSSVGGKVYANRWGSWVRALHAFVGKVNEDAPAEIENGRPNGGEGVQPSRRRESRTDDDGRIRLGVRYRVLVRDDFKCVLCGASPATDPACRLHVDHVVPFSKGGPTVIENLRTLCANCNVGKGAEMIED